MASKQEQLQQLKRARSLARAHVTRKINRIRELMNNPDNLSTVKDLLNELPNVLYEFQTAHKAYHSHTYDENELHESEQYCNDVKLPVTELEHEIDSLVKQVNIEKSFKGQHVSETQIHVQPEDFISNVGSHVSSRSNSRCSSTRSTSSAKAKATAKKAALETRAETLRRLH